MKKSLLLTLIGIFLLSVNHLQAQTWNTLGTTQFTNDPAYFATAVDESTGNLYVAYVDQSDSDNLKVKYFDGSVWTDVGGTVNNPIGSVFFPSIRVNPVTNEVWVAYRTDINSTSRLLMVKRFDGSAWIEEGNNIASPDVPTQKMILRFSPAGEAFIAYMINSGGIQAAVISNRTGSWNEEIRKGALYSFALDYPSYRLFHTGRFVSQSFPLPDLIRTTRNVYNESTDAWSGNQSLSEVIALQTGYVGLSVNTRSYETFQRIGTPVTHTYFTRTTGPNFASPPDANQARGQSLQYVYNSVDGNSYLLYIKSTGEVIVSKYDIGADTWTDVTSLDVNLGTVPSTGPLALSAKINIRKSDGSVFVTYRDGASITTKYFDVIPAPTKIYVDQNATGNNDGSSWANAYTDLQDGIDAAKSDFIADSLWVAQGTYKPDASDRDQSFLIDGNGLKLFGGFSGNETQFNERNVIANPTIISGDLNDNDDHNDLTYGSFARLDNSYRLLSVGADNVEINGFTITGGHANAATTFEGSAIFMSSTYSGLIIKKCEFSYNVSNRNGALHLDFGGGSNSKSLTIENSTFHHNLGRNSGAIQVILGNGTATLDFNLNNNLFHNNIARDLDNGDAGWSGSSVGVFSNNGAINVTAINNTFAFNIDAGTNAPNDAGTIVMRRRDGNANEVINAEFHNNIFWGNYSDEVQTVNPQNIGRMNSSNVLTSLNFTYNNSNQTNLSTKFGSTTESNTTNVDPLFVDEANFDFSLQSTSPMIDAGDNTQIPSGITTDLRGFDRIFNTTVDLGPYEYFVDNTAPTVVTKDITVSLDENGSVTVNPRDVDNGSTDDIITASNLNFSLDQNTFSCADIGANSVTLTVSDFSGNTTTGTATITVEDGAAPTAVAQDITVNLDANGVATVDPANVNNGSTDNCGIAEFNILNNLTYGCDDVGANTDFFQVVDNAGNTTSVEFTVTVVDDILPTAVAQDITIQLDENGNAEIQAEDLDNGSNDNCSIASFNADVTSFDCSNVGANTVTFLVTDGSGKSATATTTVTVEDSTAPTVLTQDLEFEIEPGDEIVITAEDLDNGITDNCSFTLSLDKTTFTLADLGTNAVTLTAEDAAGNTAAATATVTISQLKESQSITFEALAAKTYGDTPFTLTASASSGLEVDFEVVDGPISLNGNEVSITGTGNVTIRAIQTGNNEYSAADPVEQSFTIAKAGLTVSAEDKEMIYGDEFPAFTYQIDGFVYNEDENVLTSPVEVNTDADQNSNAGEYDIIASGAAADNYDISYEAAVLTILKASQAITFDPIDDVDIENTTELTLSASSTSGLAVNFEVLSGPATLNGNILTLTGVGAVNIAASQPGNENYEAAETLTQSFDVFSSAKEVQTISFEPLAAKTFGDDAFELSASASSGLSVSYSSSDETVATIDGTTVTILSAGTTIITASQAGNDEYNPAASVSQELLVNKADQEITIEEIEDKDIAAADFEVIATTTSGLELSYAVLTGPATIDGNLVSLSGAEGTVEIEVSQSGNINYNAASATTVIEVVEDPCIGFDATATVLENASCYGEANGSFEVAVTNGTAPFTYNIGGESQDNGLFENQAAGSYEVTVTDANGCTALTSIEISEPEAIEVTAEVTDSNSINGNGTITLTVTGGSGNFTYDWSNGETTANLSDLEIGEYSVTITDEAGCSITESYTIGGVTANSEAFELNIYPNPVINQVQVIHGEKVSQITLIDANGKIIAQQKTEGTQTQLEMKALPAGMYFIRLDDGKMKRIIKQ